MTSPDTVRIEVVCALPDRQVVINLSLAAGTTVIRAIECSGLLEKFPGIDPAKTGAAIYGRPVSLDRILADGERVEICRPLAQDPKQARRERASRRS